MTTAIGITLALLGPFGAATMPKAETVLVLEPSDDNPRNSEGDFVHLDDGRILFVYTHFTGGGADHSEAHLASRVSSDAGRTWSDQDVVLLPNEGGCNVMSVSLLRLDSGAIALFYLRKNSNEDCIPYLRTSTDEAKTWSDPIRCIPRQGYFVVNNDRVIQLHSGRLLIPASLHGLPGKGFFSRGIAMCFLSDDGGATWRQSASTLEAPAGSKSGLQEPGVIQCEDGRLMMLCRTDQGCQMRSWSNDGGDTWSPAEMTNIRSPVSPASFERIPKTGDWLLVWNNHTGIPKELEGKRTPFTLAVSPDEGRTWHHLQDLYDDPDGWYCYTAITFAKDHVLLGHCAGDPKVGRLSRSKITRIPVDALYR
ncbi:MAG TPA: exo-alpha-sialidase [Candidatus Hydrogenedentes bacterium]|nr:exo-alpha-sialidase [Candidatus Hydrogenedentota bacterium]